VIDLRTRLILCAQALSTNDLRAANEQLEQIRQHSSRFGDGNQRLAHVFANALEARIAGTGNEIYTALCSKRKPAADVLKAYELYLSACPFKRSAIYFANRSILELVKEKKATTLHVVDFGILHGFQWPPLISRLLQLIQGPLKLRITGIDLPTYGFCHYNKNWQGRRFFNGVCQKRRPKTNFSLMHPRKYGVFQKRHTFCG